MGVGGRMTALERTVAAATAVCFYASSVVAAAMLMGWNGPASDAPMLLASPQRGPSGSVPAAHASLPIPQAVPTDPDGPEPVVVIGSISIPTLGLEVPIHEGISLHNINLGPSHWPGTAMPGQTGNAVFAGHRVSHSHPFLHIELLKPGDPVVFTVAMPGHPPVMSTYTVTWSAVVPPSELSIVDQTEAPTATLFACHPPHSTALRYVVRLSLASSP